MGCSRLTDAPQRLCVPLEAKPDALPTFADDEAWYTYVSGAQRFCCGH
jgi:hypothetical protein